MKAKYVGAIALILTGYFSYGNPPAEQGKAIFTARCASCHSVNKVLTGPALAGVHERRSIDWIISFVRSSQTLVKNGDRDAVALFEKFNKIPMPDHSDLTAEDVKNVIEYIKLETKADVSEKAPFARPEKLRPAYIPLSVTGDYGVIIGFLSAVVLLIAILVFAVHVKEYERERG